MVSGCRVDMVGGFAPTYRLLRLTNNNRVVVRKLSVPFLSSMSAITDKTMKKITLQQ